MGLFGKSPFEKGRKCFEQAHKAMSRGDHAATLRHALEAIPFLEEAGEEGFELLATAHMAVAIGMAGQGNLDGALVEFEKMFAFYVPDGPLADPQEVKEATVGLSDFFQKAGRMDMVAHWFDRAARGYASQSGVQRALAADVHMARYTALGGGKDAVGWLDEAYEAALLDPYGYLLSNRAQSMTREYISHGAAARALTFVERGIEALDRNHRADGIPEEDAGDDGFAGDRWRFVAFQHGLKQGGATPRPIVTLQAERASLLLELGRIDEALDACRIVETARNSDAQRPTDEADLDDDEVMTELMEAMEQLGSVAPVGGISAIDVYPGPFLYVFGEALRRKGDLAAARTRLEEAQAIMEGEENELVRKIDEALAKC